MTQTPRLTLAGVVLGAPDPRALAEFYRRLLAWDLVTDEPGWVQLAPPDGARPALSFQEEPNHVRPTWPAGPGDQQMMIHLDIRVDDLEAAGAHAVEAGAELAEHQPQDDVRVYLDPAGHPFCLFL
ncbi:catechol 2,3-dioxygenase-like lactoylglutathione lyase family enzyme [Georgenia soli]|uniref:Catechol 2,3-dioxygenase-like lactoylglutathione lyase family enzyme n=1 Tax=Georgenia soli TaxID=638953 RepID=A0A2A9ER06_9MICO|nr:VOC family protein [Georgenia soli]PFG40961.1 catechol 2,3-dioxygenase-like lactoylglutathione lyase family enzyme [Georgenia soli]